MRGTLTRFNQQNGKGSITSEQGIEILVYKDAVEPSPQPLQQGQRVEFRIYYGPFGPLAENVHGSLD
jgi:cold shock CspA family protein